MATATSRGVSGQTAADESVDEASEFELQPDVFEDVPEPPATRASGDQDGFEQATVVRLFKELNYDPPVDDEFDGRHT